MTAACNLSNWSQVHAVSNVSLIVAERDERVARVGRTQERVAPVAGRAFARTRVGRIRTTAAIVDDRAPYVAQALSRAPDPCVERMIGGLERDEQNRVARRVGIAERGLHRVEQSAVRGVQARLRDRARAPRTPCSKSAKRAVADARKVGRSCSRIHASVITPSMPSEPRSSRSGDGPAPEPGSRRLSHSPFGVSARIDSTKSSMCVCSVAK